MNFTATDIQKIKLIIWDLDETFWKGTLSDYDNGRTSVVPIPENVSLVKELTYRGIVNSICSKNDQVEAEDKLSELGVLEYFVFRSINWEPKGGRIKDLIQAMALREENVLFIDDNISNLKEAEFLCPSLMIAMPSEIKVLIDNTSSLGKRDESCSRLRQYQILEKKRLDAGLYSSNTDFLKHSGIKICFNEDISADLLRIHELISRSNQLNFTKKRISLEELKALAEDASIRSGSVSVRDNYGDYGLVGFYAVSGQELRHFLFSCRTMGMGIEQYVYARLGYPDLKVVEPVSGKVSKDAKTPEYIREVTSLDEMVIQKPLEGMPRILFKGPCDLQVMTTYINYAGTITTEFNFIDDHGNQADFFNHSVNILNAHHLSLIEKEAFCKQVPFVSMQAFDTDLFSGQYDVVCLSPLMDATLSVYEDEETKIRFPFGLYSKPLTDSGNWQAYINKEVMTARCSFSKESLQIFCDRFKLLSYSPREIADNFVQIIEEVKKSNPQTRFVLLLLSELPYRSSTSDFIGKENIHKDINDALKHSFSQCDDVYLLDVNKYIHKQTDYFDNINHYSKLVYYHMAQEFVEYINAATTTGLRTISQFRALRDNVKRLIYKILILRH